MFSRIKTYFRRDENLIIKNTKILCIIPLIYENLIKRLKNY